MEAPILFTKWNGPDGLCEFIFQRTGCRPFSGAGICPRIQHQTTILRSVDNTYYYDDDLSDITNVKYTLFGHNGDQSVSEPKFNEPLLNVNKTTHIYLYRVNPTAAQHKYIWYGRYQIIDSETRPHVGKDGIMRNIIVLTLHSVEYLKQPHITT